MTLQADYDFVEGDTGATLIITCADKRTGNVIDITGYTARLRWTTGGQTYDQPMFVDQPSLGRCSYAFVANELVRGVMRFAVALIDANGKETGNLNDIVATVRQRIP